MPAGCSFVSVTQAFNTTTSMGRLTLNVLLSFAQFEREVTAERIRDKIAASKKKGMWMGGIVPLGYDPHPDPSKRRAGRQRRPRPSWSARSSASTTSSGCLRHVEDAAAEQRLPLEAAHLRHGRTSGRRCPLARADPPPLTNPTYRGLIRHKDQCYPGLHPAIIEQDLWDRVQARLQAAGVRAGHSEGGIAG